MKKKNKVIAWYKGESISWSKFESHVTQTRFQIVQSNDDRPGLSTKVLNLCEDRYHFLVVFTASILSGRTTVMPANQSEGELSRLITSNKDIQLVSDDKIEDICQAGIGSSTADFTWDVNLVPNALIVAELYTSGSTGMPTAHNKTWGQLVDGAQQVCARFAMNQTGQTSIIATVPPQHMFGFEMSIVLPLVCDVFIHHGRPFYPLDIQCAVNEMPAPRVLVTTPTHLNACIMLHINWDKLEKVVSATSPLSIEVASQVENLMNTNAEEIYGCSEIGAIATRRVTQDPNWELLPHYSLSIIDGKERLKVPAISNLLSIPDKLDMVSETKFSLLGRETDMVKMGGKRSSLAELTAHIKSLAGVKDAVVFMGEHKEVRRERLAALVIAPEVTLEQLRIELLKKIDPVFLPRPMYLVQSLPYTSTGKLPRADLLTSLNNYLNEVKAC